MGRQVQNAINVIFAVKRKNENYEQAVLSILKDPLNFWSIQEKLKIEEFLLIEILDKLLADEKILLNNSEKYFKK